MVPPFFILALPRSRTAWLSRFLSYQDWYCGHDQLRYCRTLDDVKAWNSQPNTGSCETAGAPFWRLLPQGAKVVVVRRPIDEVMGSLWALGLRVPQEALRRKLERLDSKLLQAAGRVPGAMLVSYRDLEREATCAQVFEYCLPYPHNPEWYKTVAGVNIQVNFPAIIRYMIANAPALTRLTEQAKAAMLASLSARPVMLPQDLTITEEPIDSVLVDCEALFQQHCVSVGEAPGNWKTKNIPLMKQLHGLGCMQILVARSAGKPVGYLMTFISPSLEAEGRTLGQHGMFYGDPRFPGLGLKLQRAAIAALRGKNVFEVFGRAGIRGGGERLGSLYRRLGAEPFGEMFRLELGGVN